jgi:hypothetical protein
MKNLLVMLTIFYSINAGAVVNSVDQVRKVVNWTPTNTLQVNLTAVDADSENYGILSYSWNTRYEDVDAEVANIKSMYPGYTLQNNNLESVDGVVLSIPAASYELSLTTYPSTSGFYAENNAILSKKQYQSILAAKNRAPNNYVMLNGTAHTHKTMSEKVESAAITDTNCQDLLGDGTLGSMLTKMFQYGQKVEREGTFQSGEMRTLYLEAIKNSCFNVGKSTNITSVAALMKVKLTMNPEHTLVVDRWAVKSIPVDMPVPYVVKPWQSK